MVKHSKKDDLERYQGEYSEAKFWRKLGRFAESLGKEVVYQILVLYYVMETLPLKEKALVIGALGYLILPFDLVPDFIPILGFSDDASAILMVYQHVKSHITPVIEYYARTKLEELFS